MKVDFVDCYCSNLPIKPTLLFLLQLSLPLLLLVEQPLYESVLLLPAHANRAPRFRLEGTDSSEFFLFELLLLLLTLPRVVVQFFVDRRGRAAVVAETLRPEGGLLPELFVAFLDFQHSLFVQFLPLFV